MRISKWIYYLCIVCGICAAYAVNISGNSANNSDCLKSTELIYKCDFNEPDSINDWVMEGPGVIKWQKGKMILVPLAQAEIFDKWDRSGRKKLHVYKEYYPIVEECIQKKNPHMVDKLRNREGVFCGGHIVCWNKAFETGDSYMVEYDFRPVSPIGLAILFFSAEGEKGKDIFSKDLKPRYGVFSSYTRGDINCYHISYWANNSTTGKRGTCNLRKNPGFYCLNNGYDPSSKDLDYSQANFDFKTYKIKLLKIQDTIKFYMDNELAIVYVDKGKNDILKADGSLDRKNVDTGSVLGGGRVGLRQMVGLKAEYSDFKVYKID